MSYFPTIPCFLLGEGGVFHEWLISPGQSSSLAHQSVNSNVVLLFRRNASHPNGRFRQGEIWRSLEAMSPSGLRILADEFVQLTEERVVGQTCCFTCLIAGSLPFWEAPPFPRDRWNFWVSATVWILRYVYILKLCVHTWNIDTQLDPPFCALHAYHPN